MLIQAAACAVVAVALLAMPPGQHAHVGTSTDRNATVVYIDPFEHAGVRPIAYTPPR
ncbi:hypothetical protein [Leifsonia sp. EB34]|uniref:hypothetical protein n=1 Tax=Leifsonia sp. EB34 TaxID=3156303 RepID=UPI0035172DA5